MNWRRQEWKESDGLGADLVGGGSGVRPITKVVEDAFFALVRECRTLLVLVLSLLTQRLLTLGHSLDKLHHDVDDSLAVLVGRPLADVCDEHTRLHCAKLVSVTSRTMKKKLTSANTRARW